MTGILMTRLQIFRHSFAVSRVMRKSVFGVSDQAIRKTGDTTTDDDLRLELSELGRRVWSENKGADQLCGYSSADLRLYFAYAKTGCLKTPLIFKEDKVSNHPLTAPTGFRAKQKQKKIFRLMYYKTYVSQNV